MKISNLSLEEIKAIVSKRTGKKGIIYTDINGKKYVGNSDGRLDIVHTIKGEVVKTLEDSEIDKVGKYKRADIISNLDQVTTNINDISTLKKIKADKSFAIAMSIIL